MPVNLLAICKSNEALDVKRVQVSAEVQSLLEGVFLQQEQDFLHNITEEVAFDGGWKPERNEILTLPATHEVETVFQEAQRDILGLPLLDAANMLNEGIKAIGVVVQRQSRHRLLLQAFDARQILQQKFSLILNNNTFNQLTEPAFCLASGLTGIVEDGHVKFRSFSKIRLIFALRHLYIEATDAQLDVFTNHTSLEVANANQFRSVADQGVRKLVHAITHRGTLDNYSTAEICEAAFSQGLTITRNGDKIVVPQDKRSIKRLLAFLDDAYYRASLSGLLYITNSKRVDNSNG